MKRRVIQHGPSTLILSLPQKWVKANNIVKGDELDVEDQGKVLVVTSDKKRKTLETEVDLTSFKPIAQRILHGLYKKGYDQVKLLYDSIETLELIQKMLHEEVVGFEITDQKEGFCIIKNIAGEFDSEFDSMLKRTFNLLVVMNDGILNSLEKNEKKFLPSTRYLEKDNNKYTGFCRRILNKGGATQYRNVITYMYTTLEELERVADEYKYMCDFLVEKDLAKVDKSIIKVFKRIQDLLQKTQITFFAYDGQKLSEAFTLRKEIIKECFDLAKSMEKDNITILEYAKKIAQHMANILSYKMQIEL